MKVFPHLGCNNRFIWRSKLNFWLKIVDVVHPKGWLFSCSILWRNLGRKINITTDFTTHSCIASNLWHSKGNLIDTQVPDRCIHALVLSLLALSREKERDLLFHCKRLEIDFLTLDSVFYIDLFVSEDNDDWFCGIVAKCAKHKS